MRPFVLSDALAGAPLVTRDGQHVRNFRFDSSSPGDSVKQDYRYDVSFCGFYCTADGQVHPRPECEHLDLFMAETEESK